MKKASKSTKSDKVEMLHENLHVLKIQRPVYDSEGQMHKILVYNQDRSIETETWIGPQATAEIFPNEEYKVFVLGKILRDGKLYLHEIIPDKEWPDW